MAKAVPHRLASHLTVALVTAIVIALAQVPARVAAAEAASPSLTSFSYVSSPGDPVGQGQSATLAPPTATFSLGAAQAGHATFGSIGIGIDTPSTHWGISIQAAYNAQLHPGTYANTSTADFAGPYFNVFSFSSVSCDTYYTTFTIYHISSAPTGAITVLDAGFTQHCDSPTAPPLTGTILYNAPPAAPLQLTSTYPSSLFLQPVPLTAVATDQGHGVPTGSVTFVDGNIPLGTATLDAAGIATLTPQRLAIGSHAISALYSGDSQNPPASAAVITQTVVDNSTSLYVVSSAAFPGSRGGTETPTRSTATFRPHCAILPSNQSCFDLTIDNGGWDLLFVAGLNGRLHTGTFSAPSPAPATEPTISITSGSYACSTYGSFTIFHLVADTSGAITRFEASFDAQCNDVNPGPATVRGMVDYHAPDVAPLTLTSSNPSTVVGEPTTFTAVADDLGVGIPTGTVEFRDGNKHLATEPLDSSGIATFSTAKLHAGAHQISAAYSGDALHPAASHAVVDQTVETNSTSYYFISAEGDYIGFGAQASYIPSAGTTFSLAGSSSTFARIRVNAPTDNWEIDLSAPNGGVLRSGTTYTGGIGVSGDSRGCDSYYGMFTIRHILFGSSGTPLRLDVSFTAECNYPTAPPLFGVMLYQQAS